MGDAREKSVELEYYDTVQQKQVDWLWYPYIPYGKITLLQGDPGDGNDKDSLRWCIAKPDKRKSRKISSKEFSRKIYELMDWNEKCRYKILGHRINFQDDVLYVFELDETEIVFERKKKTVAEAVKQTEETTLTPEQIEERKKEEADMPVKPFYPDDWDNSFGVPVDEHKNVSIDSTDSYASVSEMREGQGGPG